MRLVLILPYLQIKILRFREVNVLAQVRGTEYEFEPKNVRSQHLYSFYYIYLCSQNFRIFQGKKLKRVSWNEEWEWPSTTITPTRFTEWEGLWQWAGLLVATDYPPGPELRSAHDLQQTLSLSGPQFPHLWERSKRTGGLPARRKMVTSLLPSQCKSSGKGF